MYRSKLQIKVDNINRLKYRRTFCSTNSITQRLTQETPFYPSNDLNNHD